MNWSDYPMWGTISLIGCWAVRAVYGLLLARMALRHGQPLVLRNLGGYQLGKDAIDQKPEPKTKVSSPRSNTLKTGSSAPPSA